MTKNRFALVGCSLLMVFVGLLAACRGFSPREQALEAIVVVLQTRVAKVENPSASPTANSLPSPAPTAILTTVTPLTTGSVTDTLAARIDQYIRDYNRSHNPEFSGTILIARQGKVLVRQGFGGALFGSTDIQRVPEQDVYFDSVHRGLRWGVWIWLGDLSTGRAASH